ncbi:MAG: family 16 glycoside hydrolase [Fimbriimonadales bacterium]
MLTTVIALSLAVTPLIPDRPRDIWAFRSVLDGRARILTIALHKDLWVAYDATNCGLYRAWTGGVKFDGAVYTTVHGPQPTSMGTVHLPGIVDEGVWTAAGAKPEFKGYRIEGGKITLQYRIRLPGNGTAWVYENPEVKVQPDGKLALERSFRTKGFRSGERASLTMLAPRGWSDQSFRRTGERTVGGQAFDEGELTVSNGTRITTVYTPGGEQFAGLIPIRSFRPQEPPRERGLALRVYWIGSAMDKIPRLLDGQTPNYSVVVPMVDFSKASEFGMEGEHFYSRLTGFLNIQTAGEYEFRLTSDDGSRFMIRDEVIVDHDGLHSADPPKTGKFRLAAGEHPIEIEYFENTFDEALKLEWKTPGSTRFEVVPASAFSTQAGEVRVTSPGKKRTFDLARRFRPGDGLPLAGVHPAFDLETVRPDNFEPRVGGMDFLPNGRMVICTWDPDGAVYLLDGVQARKPHNIKVKRIAAGLAEPLGLKVVNGDIYVLQKQELTKLIDHDGDDVINEYYAVANGWGVTANFHEFAFGLLYDKGFFYANLAIAIDPGGKSTQPQNPDRGKVVKISKDGDFEFVASGLRTPNGIGFGYNGEIFVTDNQGDWLPSSKVMHYAPGAFFGSRAVEPETKLVEKPPVVWLPQGEIGNSPSQCAPLNVGPYRNQMIHGDVTHGGVKRVFVEEVGGQLQGCVFRFTQGLEAGINRLVWGPDRNLYVGGIGSTGNWGQEGKKRYGLQRLAYNGKSAFEMLAVRAKTNGMELELTQPLMPGMGDGTGDYTVRMWRYVPTIEYGGPKIDERPLTVKSVTVSRDRKRVFLELPGIKAGRVVHIKIGRGIVSASNADLWTTEGWYTLNRIPANQPGRSNALRNMNALTPEEARQGFELLFDGKATDKWRGFRKQTLPRGWSASDGELGLAKGAGAGDIVTKDQYSDFELRLEWKVSPGGNSGIFFRVSEELTAVYLSAPEMQVLDDDLHPDGMNPLTMAGSNYALHARRRDVVRPAGNWNDVRIIAKGNDIEYWLNGYRVVSYKLGSPEWTSLVTKSKFADWPSYGKVKTGHIALQDHGDAVAFRNIRIRKL